jgi:hypothetical protein
MKAPEFSYARGIARCAWSEPPVELKFDLLRMERRTGELSAELTVISTASPNGSAGLLHRARLNLGSTRSRADYTNHLSRRLSGLDWPGLVEAAAWKVIESYRLGRPAILLRDAVEPPAAGWALKPVLLARDPVIVFGDGGDLKSYLSLGFGVALQSGLQLTPGLEPTRPFRVAYCDWEWQEWPHKRRMRALCGPGEMPEILYVPCGAEGPLTHQVERLQRIFQEHRIEYAILDSVGLACDGPPEEAQSAIGFFQAFARLEVGGELIAHTSKDSDTMKPFGSAYWHNSARATWYVKRLRTDAGGVDIAVIQRKANDGSPRLEPIGLRFAFADASTTISAIELGSAQAAGALKDRFVAALRAAGGSLTYAELAKAANVAGKRPVDTAHITVKRYPDVFTVLEDSPHHHVVLAPEMGSNKPLEQPDADLPSNNAADSHLTTEAVPGPE